MYAGRVAEEGATADILTCPLHPYSKGLINSMPGVSSMKKKGGYMPTIPGRVPSPAEFENLTACRFAPRCGYAGPLCGEEQPPLRALNGRKVACHFAPIEQREGA